MSRLAGRWRFNGSMTNGHQASTHRASHSAQRHPFVSSAPPSSIWSLSEACCRGGLVDLRVFDRGAFVNFDLIAEGDVGTGAVSAAVDDPGAVNEVVDRESRSLHLAVSHADLVAPPDTDVPLPIVILQSDMRMVFLDSCCCDRGGDHRFSRLIYCGHGDEVTSGRNDGRSKRCRRCSPRRVCRELRRSDCSPCSPKVATWVCRSGRSAASGSPSSVTILVELSRFEPPPRGPTDSGPLWQPVPSSMATRAMGQPLSPRPVYGFQVVHESLPHRTNSGYVSQGSVGDQKQVL
jgi:hypothetical protein